MDNSHPHSSQRTNVKKNDIPSIFKVQENVQIPESDIGSVQELWRKYAMETTMHGIKLTVKQHRWPPARFCWILCVIFMIIALSYNLIQILVAYKHYPYTTVLKISHESNISMPAITFCLPSLVNMNKLKNNSEIYEYFSKTETFYPLEKFYPNTTERELFLNRSKELMSRITVSEFLKANQFDTNDVFRYVIIGSKRIKKEDIKKWIHIVPELQKSCWVLRGKKRTMSTFEDITVYADVHSQSHPPNILYSGLEIYIDDRIKHQTNQGGHLIRPGTYTLIQFNKEEHHYLPQPYKSFGEHGCFEVNKQDFTNPLKSGKTYTKIECVHEHSMLQASQKCGCILLNNVNVQKDIDNFTECSLQQSRDCFANEYSRYFNDVIIQNKLNDLGCLPMCSFTKYNLFLSSANFPILSQVDYLQNEITAGNFERFRDNIVRLVIKRKDALVTIIEHVPEMSFTSIYATLGGHLSLFLGASLLTMTEFIQTVLVSLGLLVVQWRLRAFS